MRLNVKYGGPSISSVKDIQTIAHNIRLLSKKNEVTVVCSAVHGITDDLIEISDLISTYKQGKISREGASVALLGKPNVGKSSLLNALLQEDRAIVTPHPGTTRDTLEEKVRIKDTHINIIDSAGLRKYPEIIDAIADLSRS